MTMPQPRWHLSRGGQTYGPYTWEQVVEHTRAGRIGRGDKLFDPRSGVWARPSKIPGLLGPGGAATIPAGLAAVSMTAVGIVITLALLVASILYFLIPSDTPSATLEANPGSRIVQQGAAASSTSPTVVMAPEGFTFKGTYTAEWAERDAPGGTLVAAGPCYLWIFTTESGTRATFKFLKNIDIDHPSWDGRTWIPLVSHTGSHYVFQSSSSTRVDKWKLVVDITDTGMSGTIRNIDFPDIGSFVGGSFSGQSISYEQYQAEDPERGSSP